MISCEHCQNTMNKKIILSQAMIYSNLGTRRIKAQQQAFEKPNTLKSCLAVMHCHCACAHTTVTVHHSVIKVAALCESVTLFPWVFMNYEWINT